MSENNIELNFNELPYDVKKTIMQFLDHRKLSFFSSTNKYYLNDVIKLLKEREEIIKLSISCNRSSYFFYNSKKIFVCGRNEDGKLGLGDCKDRKVFTIVPNVSGRIQQVVDGRQHTVVHTDKGLFVSGSYQMGALGLGGEIKDDRYFFGMNKDYETTFTQLSNVKGKIIQIAAGFDHTVVWTTEGLFTCGDNYWGQLGLGDTISRGVLTLVEVPGKIIQISANQTQTIVLTDQGLFVCGCNECGPLGLEPCQRIDRFTRVNIAYDISQIISSYNKTFLVTTNGELLVSGACALGALGLDYEISTHFVKVTILGKVLQVAAGWLHTFVLTDQGLFVCGSNENFRLGTEQSIHMELTQINPPPGRILQIVAGLSNSMILTDKGLFACGEYKDGLLGLENICKKFTQVDNLPEEIKEYIFLARLIRMLEKRAEKSKLNEQNVKLIDFNVSNMNPGH